MYLMQFLYVILYELLERMQAKVYLGSYTFGAKSKLEGKQ